MSREDTDILIAKINGANNVAIMMHHNPDGDAFGSALGLYYILRDNMDTTATLLYPGEIPPFLMFLAGSNLPINIRKYKSSTPFDLIIAVDTAAIELLRDEGISLFMASRDTVKIDHHGDSEDFANLNICDVVPSTAEVIYNIAKLRGWSINQNAATALFTAINTDTGNFSYIEKPDTFNIAGDLVKLGANPREIAANLGTKDKDSVLINAKAVLEAKFYFGGKLAVSVLTREQTRLLSGKGTDAMDALRSIDSVEYVALIKEGLDDVVFVSLRSSNKPVNIIANELGGGGHIFAAAAKLTGTISDARELTLCAFEKNLNEKR